MSNLDCEEVGNLLDAYLDSEVDALLSAKLEEHLRSCASCSHELAEREILFTRIRTNASYYNAPIGLYRNVVEALPHRVKRQWMSKRWGLELVGASCVFALGVLAAILFVMPYSADSNFSDAIVTNHIQSLLVGHLMDVASSDKHTVKPWFAGKIDYAFDVPDFSSQGFPLLGGRLVYLNHHQIASLIYGHGKHVMNVYVAPEAELHSTNGNLEVRGYHILSWSRSGLRYIAISDMEEQAIATFETLSK